MYRSLHEDDGAAAASNDPYFQDLEDEDDNDVITLFDVAGNSAYFIG